MNFQVDNRTADIASDTAVTQKLPSIVEDVNALKQKLPYISDALPPLRVPNVSTFSQTTSSSSLLDLPITLTSSFTPKSYANSYAYMYPQSAKSLPFGRPEQRLTAVVDEILKISNATPQNIDQGHVEPTVNAQQHTSDQANSYYSYPQINLADYGFVNADGDDEVRRRPNRRKSRRGNNNQEQRCHSCNCTETPEWRRGPDGARTLCNACGLHYAKLLKKKRQNALDLTSKEPPTSRNSATNLLSMAAKSSFDNLQRK